MDKKEQEFLQKKAKWLSHLLNGHKYTDLIAEAKNLREKYPEVYFFSNAIGLGYHGLGQNKEAQYIFEKALEVHKDNVHILNNLGMVLSAQDKDQEAEKYLIKALKISPKHLSARITFSNIKRKFNKYDEAIENLKLIYNNYSNEYIINFNLAIAYQESGDFENAKKFHNICTEKFPHITSSDKALTEMRKFTDKNDIHLINMLEKVKKIENLDLQNRVRLYFALGKVYEDLNDYDTSFKYLKIGNDLKKEMVKFDINKEKRNFEIIKDRLSLKNLEASESSPILVFVLGMPRSGTTLVEQILSSHKEVYGAGELNYIYKIVENNIFNDGIIKLETISRKEIQNFKNLYLEEIKKYNSSKKFFVDKALLNFKWIGILVNMFPNCKIVNCSRDPLDTCISNYKNTFGSSRLDFCYDLESLGKYYNLYKDIMMHWNNLYSKKIINFNYEELIENPEAKTKELLKFCGLQWDENCLEFFKNKRAVATASLVQIRNPIYKSSVKSWKNYEKHIGKLIDIIN